MSEELFLEGVTVITEVLFVTLLCTNGAPILAVYTVYASCMCHPKIFFSWIRHLDKMDNNSIRGTKRLKARKSKLEWEGWEEELWKRFHLSLVSKLFRRWHLIHLSALTKVKVANLCLHIRRSVWYHHRIYLCFSWHPWFQQKCSDKKTLQIQIMFPPLHSWNQITGNAKHVSSSLIPLNKQKRPSNLSVLLTTAITRISIPGSLIYVNFFLTSFN